MDVVWDNTFYYTFIYWPLIFLSHVIVVLFHSFHDFNYFIRLELQSLFIVAQDLFHCRIVTWCYTAASVSFYIAKKAHIHLTLVQYVITRVRWLNYRRLLYSIILVPFYRRSDSSEVMEVYPLPFFSLLSSPAFSCTTAVSVARKAISALLLSNIIPSKFTWVSNFRTSGSSWFISGFRWMLCAYNNQWFIDA